MKILVFTEGTALMHSAEDKMRDWKSYIPTPGAVEKLKAWVKRGHRIVYLTSRQHKEEIKSIRNVLRRYKFPGGKLYARKPEQTYVEVVELAKPDLLIENDCKSMGKNANEEIIAKNMKVKAIIVPEFGGLDHLPDDLNKMRFKK